MRRHSLSDGVGAFSIKELRNGDLKGDTLVNDCHSIPTVYQEKELGIYLNIPL